MPEEKNHVYVHLASSDLWSRDKDSKKIIKKTSGEEAGSAPTKHGEIVVKHHKERQDLE